MKRTSGNPETDTREPRGISARYQPRAVEEHPDGVLVTAADLEELSPVMVGANPGAALRPRKVVNVPRRRAIALALGALIATAMVGPLAWVAAWIGIPGAWWFGALCWTVLALALAGGAARAIVPQEVVEVLDKGQAARTRGARDASALMGRRREVTRTEEGPYEDETAAEGSSLASQRRTPPRTLARPRADGRCSDPGCGSPRLAGMHTCIDHVGKS